MRRPTNKSSLVLTLLLTSMTTLTARSAVAHERRAEPVEEDNEDDNEPLAEDAGSLDEDDPADDTDEAEGDDEALAPSTEDEAAPPSTSTPTKTPAGDLPSFQRTGVQTLLAIGTSSCFQDFCRQDGLFEKADLVPGPLLSVELGYRPIEFVDVLGGLTLSYQPMNGLSKHTYTSGWWGFNAGSNVYPIRKGRFDPYLSFMLGYYQAWFADSNGVDHTVMLSRGNFRVGAGLDIFVTRRFSIGPRVAINNAFAGRTCSWVDIPQGPVEKTCHYFKEIPRDIERGTAQPWEAVLLLKWHKNPS